MCVMSHVISSFKCLRDEIWSTCVCSARVVSLFDFAYYVVGLLFILPFGILCLSAI